VIKGKPEHPVNTRSGSRHLHRVFWLLPLLAAILSSCAPRDPYQFNICRLALPGIEDEDKQIRLVTRFDETSDGNQITLRYQLLVPGEIPLPSTETHAITCHFEAATKPNTPTNLYAIETTRLGPVSDAHMALLKRFWIDRVGRTALQSYIDPESHGLRADVPDIGLPAAYATQLVLSGLARGAIYGLLALSFTLIYGLIGRINLAFGEVVMTAALGTIITSLWISGMVGWLIPVMVVGSVAMAAFIGSGLSHLTWRNVFGPLGRRAAGGRAMIVASLGCVLVIQEFIRIVISARNFNLPPIWQFSVPLLRGDHFVVRLHGFDMLAIGGAVMVAGILVWIMGKTAFGRNWRAISQDRLGAALCGVSLSRTESQSFVLAGFLCGLTGAMLALRYGVINFHSGTLFGFKALTAAILGGIGRMRGAWLGGLMIGLTETLWSGYFGGAYRDVAVFGLLAAILVLRPQGLLGINDSHDSLFSARNGQI